MQILRLLVPAALIIRMISFNKIMQKRTIIWAELEILICVENVRLWRYKLRVGVCILWRMMRQQNKQNVYPYLHTQYLEKKDKKTACSTIYVQSKNESVHLYYIFI